MRAMREDSHTWGADTGIPCKAFPGQGMKGAYEIKICIQTTGKGLMTEVCAHLRKGRNKKQTSSANLMGDSENLHGPQDRDPHTPCSSGMQIQVMTESLHWSLPAV